MKKKDKDQAIIFVHGLWMTGMEFFYLRLKFRKQGYRVYTFHYSSIFTSPENNAEKLACFMRKVNEPEVHFVAHSLGGIVLSYLCQRQQLPTPCKVILLASPVNGSTVARSMVRHRIFRIMLGKSIINGLLDAPGWNCRCPTCVIAGSGRFGMGRFLAPGAMELTNDGTVNQSETAIKTATESHLVHHTHFSLLWSKPVFTIMLSFLNRMD